MWAKSFASRGIHVLWKKLHERTPVPGVAILLPPAVAPTMCAGVNTTCTKQLCNTLVLFTQQTVHPCMTALKGQGRDDLVQRNDLVLHEEGSI